MPAGDNVLSSEVLPILWCVSGIDSRCPPQNSLGVLPTCETQTGWGIQTMASAERNQTLVARRARAFVVRAFGDARVVHAGTIHRLQVLSRNYSTLCPRRFALTHLLNFGRK